MGDAFSSGASAVAYISVAGTATSSSYNFLRDFANAPQELQAFLDTFEVVQTTIEAFQTTLTQVRNVGLVVGHDAWKALRLATDVANEVNIFLATLRDAGDSNLTLWKKLEIAMKQKDILRYSEKLRSATVHILAVQQTICCGFQLKLLGLSQANTEALVQVRDNTVPVESLSELSAEVSDIRQTLSASISGLGSDLQTSIQQAFTELKSQSATKADLLTLTRNLDQATLGLDSEIKALLGIEPIFRRSLGMDRDLLSLREETFDITNTIVAIASRLESLGQGLADVKSKFPLTTEMLKMLDRVETLATDMAAIKSETVDKLWAMQEKLQKLASSMKEGASDVTSKRSPGSEPIFENLLGDSNSKLAELGPKALSSQGMQATASGRVQAIEETRMLQEGNGVGTEFGSSSKMSSSHALELYHPYLRMGIGPKSEIQLRSGVQHHTAQIPRNECAKDLQAYRRASKEQDSAPITVDEDVSAVKSVSPMTQELKELSSNNRTSSNSSFTTIPSTASIGSIFSVISTSSMSSVASNHGLDAFFRLLTEDSTFMSLCRGAVALHGQERFERSLRRLLIVFSRELGAESTSASQKIAVQFIRTRARRTARLVGQSAAPVDRQQSFGRYALPLRSGRTFALHENLSSDEAISDSSDSDDDFDIDAYEFELVGEHILASKAFEKLREDLRRLVYLDTKEGQVFASQNFSPEASSPPSSAIKSSAPVSSGVPKESPSRVGEREPFLEVEVLFGARTLPLKNGLRMVDEALGVIVRPICQTYNIWLPAVVGGWLGYMLHGFWNGEQHREVLRGRDAV